jgi:hypothetical protein
MVQKLNDFPDSSCQFFTATPLAEFQLPFIFLDSPYHSQKSNKNMYLGEITFILP